VSAADNDNRTYGIVAVMQAMRAGRMPAEVSAADRAVLLVYADCGGKDGVAWPALAEVAKAAGCSKDSSRRSVAVLRGVGLLRQIDPVWMGLEARVIFERIPLDRRPVVYRVDLTGLQDATPSQDAIPLQNASPSQDAASGVASCVDRGSKLLPKSRKETRKETPKVARADRGVRPGRQGSSKKEPKHERYQEVYAAYFEGYKAKYNDPPTDDGGKIGTAVNALLKKCNGDADKAIGIIVRSLKDNRRVTIGQIASNPDGYGPLAPIGGRPPPQRQAVGDVEVNRA
jgi:hypothetical protein